MKLDDLYNLSRDECFERIKGESLSQAKRGLCIGALILIIFLFGLYVWHDFEPSLVPICDFSVGCLAAACIAVNNLLFLHRLDSLSTPELLLHQYKKRFNNDRKAICFALIGGLIFNIRLWEDIINFNWGWLVIELTLFGVLIVGLIYAYFKEYDDTALNGVLTRRDEEIIGRLEDLVEKK
ncbi:MAG: hypothetical protein IKW97_03735 [Muribaculaceae bacterium]|nr:hypothetical protein [Muribaculaceae bacterium]